MAVVVHSLRLLCDYCLLTSQCMGDEADVFVYKFQNKTRVLLSPRGVGALEEVTTQVSEERLKEMQRLEPPKSPPVRAITKLRNAGLLVSLDSKLPLPDVAAHSSVVQLAWWRQTQAACDAMDMNPRRDAVRELEGASMSFAKELQAER